MYVYIYVCIYIYIFLHVNAYMFLINIYIYMHLHIYIYIYITNICYIVKCQYLCQMRLEQGTLGWTWRLQYHCVVGTIVGLVFPLLVSPLGQWLHQIVRNATKNMSVFAGKSEIKMDRQDPKPATEKSATEKSATEVRPVGRGRSSSPMRPRYPLC